MCDECWNKSRTGSCAAPSQMDSASFEQKSQSPDIVRASPGALLAPLDTRAPHFLLPTDEACVSASAELMPSLPASFLLSICLVLPPCVHTPSRRYRSAGGRDFNLSLALTREIQHYSTSGEDGSDNMICVLFIYYICTVGGKGSWKVANLASLHEIATHRTQSTSPVIACHHCRCCSAVAFASCPRHWWEEDRNGRNAAAAVRPSALDGEAGRPELGPGKFQAEEAMACR